MKIVIDLEKTILIIATLNILHYITSEVSLYKKTKQKDQTMKQEMFMKKVEMFHQKM